MNQDIVITLLQKMFILTLEISVPILLVGVVLGLYALDVQCFYNYCK